MTFADEHRLLRYQLRRFVETEIKPSGTAWEEAGSVPRPVLLAMGKIGFFGLRCARGARWRGDGRARLRRLRRGAGAVHLRRLRITVLVHTDLATPYLSTSAATCRRSAGCRGSSAARPSPPSPSPSPMPAPMSPRMRTRREARRRRIVIDGTKMFITNGATADLCLRRRPHRSLGHGPRAGSRCFAVERGAAGFSVGRSLSKMGWRSSDTAELVFEECRVPADQLIGEPDRGFYHVMHNFQNERLVIGAMAMGEAQKAIELTAPISASGEPSARRCGRSRRYGTGSPCSRPRSRRAVSSSTTPGGATAQGGDAVRQVSMVKSYCGELVNEVLAACVQFHGGMGFMRRDARWSACTATCGSTPSGAAPPRSCSRKWPSGCDEEFFPPRERGRAGAG